MWIVYSEQTFRFKTRVQRLNSIEAASRAKLNFLEQLYRFHKQQGNSRVSIPTINHKPLDLWLLRKEVQNLGGYEVVSRLTPSHTLPLYPPFVILFIRSQRANDGASLGGLLDILASLAFLHSSRAPTRESFSRMKTSIIMFATHHPCLLLFLEMHTSTLTRSPAPVE